MKFCENIKLYGTSMLAELPCPAFKLPSRTDFDEKGNTAYLIEFLAAKRSSTRALVLRLFVCLSEN